MTHGNVDKILSESEDFENIVGIYPYNIDIGANALERNAIK